MCVLVLSFATGYAQDKKPEDKAPENNDVTDTYSPIKLKLDDSGKKYVRFLFWNQIQAGVNKLGDDDQAAVINMRRLRMLVFGQFTPKFLLVFHVGTHSLNAQNESIAGKGGSDIFINDAWGEYLLIDKKLYIGGGKHYWGGISRLQLSSTFKFLTIDNANGRSWLNFGRSGSFVRELGFYAKGTLDKLQYAVSVNDAQTNYAVNDQTTVNNTTSVYGGAQLLPSYKNQGARFNYTVRLEYQFLNKEGDKLPFKSGSSFTRTGNTFNIGGGLWYHPKASLLLNSTAATPSTIGDLKKGSINDVKTEDAVHFALDMFLDKKGWTVYGLYQHNNYGTNASGSRFTGSMFTFLAGYVLPSKGKTSFQPYIGYNYLAPDVVGIDKNGGEFKLGVNILHVKNFLKTSVEYQNNTLPSATGVQATASSSLMMQMQFIL